jgi:hypothetical protein
MTGHPRVGSKGRDGGGTSTEGRWPQASASSSHLWGDLKSTPERTSLKLLNFHNLFEEAVEGKLVARGKFDLSKKKE